jgi:uncharacterized RDD family membrane protein YckC
MSVGSLSLDLSIETPENVVLTHELAGPGWRCVAFLVDFVICCVVIVAAFMVTLIFAMALPGLAVGSFLLLLFLVQWGYGIGFEYAWQGRTPGKWMCGLRVIHENGQPLSWWGAALRNLLRVADALPLALMYGDSAGPLVLVPVYGPALGSMALTSKLQRLGDLAARTVVVHERRTTLPRDPAIYEHITRLPAEHRPRVPPRSETLALIDEFLNRRPVLTYQRGHDLASELAVALATSWNYPGDWEQVRKYPMAFLARVYVTFAIPESDDTNGKPSARNPAEAAA